MLYAVIMAGGSGTRFWPASRERLPKQLLALTGRSTESLLAATVRRLAPLVPEERVFIATGVHLADATARALPTIPRANVLAEPAPRNTAPCIGWALAKLSRTDPDAVLAVLPSDHFVADEVGFLRVLALAVASAEQGRITTVGIVPTRPETGYGYIEVGAPLDNGACRVARFTEKPSRPVAEAFLEGKRHLWNAGMFFFRARDMRAAIARHLPELDAVLGHLDDAARIGEEVRALEEWFPRLRPVSIDQGVLEHESDLAVVPGDFGWNDVGSWQSAWELAPKDDHGNAAPDGTVFVDARNNLVRDLRSDGRVYALVGVEGLAVVETDDAVLVIPRERAQDVRAVVEALKKSGRTSRT
jgi:mannose-1-phosphate guanylyltransferase